MEKQSRCFVAAGLAAMLLFSLAALADAQMKQGAGITGLTLGLVFEGETQPVAERFRPLVEYAGRKLASAGEIKSNVIVAPNTAQLTKLLNEQRVDFYLESAHPTYLINRFGVASILLRRWKSGMSEYRSLIVTNKTSRNARLEDLRGKMIAFEDAGSTSGYFLPKLLLFDQGFSVAEKSGSDAQVAAGEIGYIFTGNEKNTVNLVLQEKVAAGAISNDDYARLDDTSKARLSILAESEPLPRHLLSVHKNLPDPVVKRLKEILLKMHENDEGRKILRETDNTTKFDTLPGGEVLFRRKLIALFRPGGK